MTIRNTEIFVTVAALGNMSEAARALYVSQSSISQAISAIEQEYGVVLFERLNHRLYLTAAGKEMLGYAKVLLNAESDMERFLRSSGAHRMLRIGSTVTIGTCVISPLIADLRKDDPELRIEVMVENTNKIELALLNNDIDIGLVEGRINNPELITRHVIQDKLVLITPESHRFASRGIVDVKELEGEPFILREKGSGTRNQFEEQMKNLEIPVDIVWSCSNSEAIINAVEAGHGISVISERLVRESAPNKKLGICDVNQLNLERFFDVVYHKDKCITEPMNGFIQACKTYGAGTVEVGGNE